MADCLCPPRSGAHPIGLLDGVGVVFFMMRRSPLRRLPAQAVAPQLSRMEAEALVSEGSSSAEPHLVLVRTAPTWDSALQALNQMICSRVPLTPDAVHAAGNRLLQLSLSSMSVPAGAPGAVQSMVARAAVNEYVLSTSGAPDWLHPDEDLHEDDHGESDRAPADRLAQSSLAALPQFLDRPVLAMLNACGQQNTVLTPTCWRDLCVLPQHWTSALELLGRAERACPGGAPSAAMAVVGAATVAQNAPWHVSLRVFRPLMRDPSMACPAAGTALCAALKLAPTREPGINAALQLAISIVRGLGRAQERRCPQEQGHLTRTASQAFLAHGQWAEALSLLAAADWGDTSSLEVASSDGCVLMLAAMLPVVQSGVLPLDDFKAVLQKWGRWYGARWSSVSADASRVFWHYASQHAVSHKPLAEICVALALRAAKERSRCTYPQLRGPAVFLGDCAHLRWISDPTRDAMWQSSLALFGAAQEVTVRMDDHFLRATASAVANNELALRKLAGEIGTVAVSDCARALALRGDWASALRLSSTENPRGPVHDVPLRRPLLGAMREAGAWHAALHAAGIWGADISRDDSVLAPWVAKDCMRAIVQGGASDQWRTAVRCFAFSPSLTAQERTRFGAFLADAVHAPSFVELLLNSQGLLRCSLALGESSRRLLDDPRW